MPYVTKFFTPELGLERLGHKDAEKKQINIIAKDCKSVPLPLRTLSYLHGEDFWKLAPSTRFSFSFQCYEIILYIP
jgi:hypothetical protein